MVYVQSMIYMHKGGEHSGKLLTTTGYPDTKSNKKTRKIVDDE